MNNVISVYLLFADIAFIVIDSIFQFFKYKIYNTEAGRFVSIAFMILGLFIVISTKLDKSRDQHIVLFHLGMMAGLILVFIIIVFASLIVMGIKPILIIIAFLLIPLLIISIILSFKE